jgi:MFS family permease
MAKVSEGGSAGSAAPVLAVGAGAGAMTMVALCFANGLQGGAGQAFAQSTEAIKHTFHINDATLGIIPFCVAIAGNFGAIPVAAWCARHRRTAVLAGMFVGWGVLMALAGLASVFSVATIGFAMFAVFRVGSSVLEATDPAAYPLIADWWPVEERARKVSVFNTLSAVGSFGGIIGAGILVDDAGWQWAFIVWLPIALLGAALIRSRVEPPRGAQDAAYSDRLEQETFGAEHDLVVELVEHEVPLVGFEMTGSRWAVVRAVARLRSWRLAAIGVAATGIMGSANMNWGLAYFKRTFGLSGAQAAGLAPVLGIGAFAGVLGGGFLADRLLERGMLRARLYVTAAGFAGGGVFFMLAYTTTNLWVAAPLLALAAGMSTLPTGPQFAMLMDVTPADLRPQASAALNILQSTGALGALIVGILSSLLGENLRLALLCVSPFYLIGAAVVLAARRTYVEDVALVVAEAKSHGGGSDQ